MTLAATPVCADTDVMTDASVAEPQFTHESGVAPEKFKPGSKLTYAKTNESVTFVVQLTDYQNKPLKITIFGFFDVENIDWFIIKVFNKDTELTNVIRSAEGPVGPNVSMFFNKLSMMRVYAGV